MSLRPAPGDGALARARDLVLLCAAGDLTAAALAAHAEAGRTGGDGNDLASAVERAVGQAPFAGVTFGPASTGGTAVAVFGHAWADITTQYGEQRLALRQDGGGVRSILPGDLVSVRAGLGDPSEVATSDWARLDGGVVPAAGLVYVPDGAPGRHVAAPPSVAAAPAVAEPAEVQEPAAAPEPPAAPEPAVAGLVPVPPPAPSTTGMGTDPASSADGYTDGYVDGSEPTLAPPPEPPAPAPEEPASAHAAGASPADEPETIPEPPPLPDHLREPVPAAEPSVEPSVEPPVEPSAQPPVEPGPAAQVDRSQPFESVSLFPAAAPAVEQRAPLPVVDAPLPPPAPDVAPAAHPVADEGVKVLGVYCKNGHFNDPAARYCAVCGISMAQLTLIPRPGRRPPLGVLVLDDGTIFSLETDYVIGRNPDRHDAVTSGSARPLRVDDRQGTLSRAHVHIRLDQWNVTVVDLNSVNGTGILVPGEQAWRRLPPGVPVTVKPGTEVGFGQRRVRYESHTNT
ncbi:FHA domain-containing protein [Jatrophihabitans fulvus]